jgi:hypothetical protein
MMEKKLLFVFFLSLCFLYLVTGCGPSLRSSGIRTFDPRQKVENIRTSTKDIRVPRRVGVLSFGGADIICVRATEIFTKGLMNLGFDVVESKRIYEIINKEEISSFYYGEKILDDNRSLINADKWYPLPPISEETSKKLFDKLGLEALFLGHVEAGYLEIKPTFFKKGKSGSHYPENMSGKKWHTWLEMDLMLIPKGPYIWHCTTKDTHLSAKTWEASIALITKKALRQLERDIDMVK